MRSRRVGWAFSVLCLAGCAKEAAAASGDAGAMTEPPGKDRVEHVLLLSIDGLHSQDLARYISDASSSRLAQLAKLATRFDNARAPFPSDSFPSVLAWATGGTPRSTGVFYDISYDRSLSPADSDCSQRGARVDFSDAADLDNSRVDGGGGLDPKRLPRDPARDCAPVYPHDYLRVNTLFEVVKKAGKRTAWSDKHLSYEVLQGPSGEGVDDLFDPEIASVDTKSQADVQAYDDSKVQAVLRQIEGAEVPSLFGMNFQAVSVAQKNFGYQDAAGTPSAALQTALDNVDKALGRIVDALIEKKLWSSSVLVVMASHGQSPIDPAALRRINTSFIPTLVNEAAAAGLASATQDSVCLLWLKDHAQTPAVEQKLLEQKDAAGIDRLLSGSELSDMFGDPSSDARVPDIIVIAKTGTIYTDSKKKLEEHGGYSDDDRKVALLWASSVGHGQVISDAVETRQIARSVLQTLKLDPGELESQTLEPVSALGGLGL